MLQIEENVVRSESGARKYVFETAILHILALDYRDIVYRRNMTTTLSTNSGVDRNEWSLVT